MPCILLVGVLRYSAISLLLLTTTYKHIIMFGRPMIKNIGVPSIFSHHVLGGRFHGISATEKGGQISDRMFKELKDKRIRASTVWMLN